MKLKRFAIDKMEINEYMKDVRKQARMLLDQSVSSKEYFSFKLKRLNKWFGKTLLSEVQDK